MKTIRVMATLVAGMLFGFGLALSTMIQPEVILNFLQLRDMGLLLVMGGALAVAMLVFQVWPRFVRKPLAAEEFDRNSGPMTRNIWVGSAIFGIGWGLCGVCPSPAVAGIGVGNFSMLWALLGIAVGALLQGLTTKF